MRTRRRRTPFAGLGTQLRLLGALGVLAAATLATSADAGAGDAGGAGSGEPGGGGDGAPPPATGTDPDGGDEGGQDDDPLANLTAEQKAALGRVIKAEREAERTKATKAAEKAAADAAERAKMDEADRLKAEKADADKAAIEATERANQRIVRSEVKAAALAAQVDPAVIDEFMAVVHTSDIPVGDDGDPDTKAIAKAVKTVLDKPTFKAAFTKTATKGAGPSGAEHGADPGKTKATNLQQAIEAKLAS